MQYSQIVVVLATLGGLTQAANDIKRNPLVMNIVLEDRAVVTVYRSTATAVVARTSAVTSSRNGLANESGMTYLSYPAPTIAATSPMAGTRGIDSAAAAATGSPVGTGTGAGTGSGAGSGAGSGMDSGVGSGVGSGAGTGLGAVFPSVAAPSATATAMDSLTGSVMERPTEYPIESPMESPMGTAMETGASNNGTGTLDTSVAQGGVAKAAVGSGSIALAIIGLLV